MKTCGTCTNSRWERTPSGRIKAKTAGRCVKEQQLISDYSLFSAPCIRITKPIRVGIWPEYDATVCPYFNGETK